MNNKDMPKEEILVLVGLLVLMSVVFSPTFAFASNDDNDDEIITPSYPASDYKPDVADKALSLMLDQN